jgi:hypothetical protein
MDWRAEKVLVELHATMPSTTSSTGLCTEQTFHL